MTPIVQQLLKRKRTPNELQEKVHSILVARDGPRPSLFAEDFREGSVRASARLQFGSVGLSTGLPFRNTDGNETREFYLCVITGEFSDI